MFANLTTRLTRVLDGLRGRGRLTEADVDAALREVRMALLEADVALPVVKDFIERVRGQATGVEVLRSLTPGQAVVGVVHRELVATLGTPPKFDLRARPPAVVLLAGLQGAGKTTTAAKLARWIRDQLGRRVMLASTDVVRAAAVEQLQTLAQQVGVSFAENTGAQTAGARAASALNAARDQAIEVLVVDTAGRTAVDDGMMNEIAALHSYLEPAATLFVVDAMTGQEAARTARVFHERLPLTGVILTKTDGDARGGAALSVRAVTGAPLLFLGTGEKDSALEVFDPERVARRMLGMGDVVGLVEAAQEAEVDAGDAQRLARKLQSGQGFGLAEFRDQLRQMQRMGGLGALVGHLPANMLRGPLPADGDRMFRRMGGIVDSMTPMERRRPDLIKAARKRRIAAGSGTTVPEVNRLLKQFTEAQTMMKRLGGKGGAGRRSKRRR